MPSEPDLSPASSAELESAIAFALRFSGRKRIHTGDEMMARLMAEHLVSYLADAGFVVMRKPAAPLHKTPDGPKPQQ